MSPSNECKLNNNGTFDCFDLHLREIHDLLCLRQTTRLSLEVYLYKWGLLATMVEGMVTMLEKKISLAVRMCDTISTLPDVIAQQLLLIKVDTWFAKPSSTSQSVEGSYRRSRCRT